MAYRITDACLQCGVCVDKCPQGAITEELSQVEFHTRQLTLHHVSIDAEKCNDCGTCVSEEYWCPAQAIVKV